MREFKKIVDLNGITSYLIENDEDYGYLAKVSTSFGIDRYKTYNDNDYVIDYNCNKYTVNRIIDKEDKLIGYGSLSIDFTPLLEKISSIIGIELTKLIIVDNEKILFLKVIKKEKGFTYYNSFLLEPTEEQIF